MPPATQRRSSTKKSSKKGSAWITFLVIVLCLITIAVKFGKVLHLPDLRSLISHTSSPAANLPPGAIFSENHYSPAENLESFDHDRLGEAQKSVDIAMYAFTDKYLADQLLTLSRRGVVVRLYRDMDQYRQEDRNAQEHHDDSVTALLRGEKNIHIRVKSSGRRDLMHLKAYLIDGKMLRDGSANWSAAGEKVQDNNAHFTNDPLQVKAFRDAFEEMWGRSDNWEIQ